MEPLDGVVDGVMEIEGVGVCELDGEGLALV